MRNFEGLVGRILAQSSS